MKACLSRVASAALCALALAAASPSSSQTVDELYDAAKKEGKVVWYGSVAATTGQAMIDGFKKKYPGIEVEFLRQPSNTTYQRIVQELGIGAHVADVMSTTEVAHYQELTAGGHLMEYVPPEARNLLPIFQKMQDKTYQITNSALVLIVYNTNEVSGSDVPKSWKELTDPKYKGKLSLANPSASGYGAITAMVLKDLYGVEYLQALAKNEPHLTRSSNDTITLAVSGERPIAFGPSQTAYRSKEAGNPVEIVYPSDGSILQVGFSAILAKAPHPNAAKLMLNFFQSQEGASIMVSEKYEPIRSDVSAPQGKSIDEIKLIGPTTKQLIEEMEPIRRESRTIFGG